MTHIQHNFTDITDPNNKVQPKFDLLILYRCHFIEHLIVLKMLLF